MKIGIYIIKNTTNGKVYVGSSADIPQRFRAHRSLLRRGLHSNEHLQASWDLYGSENFEFIAFEETQADESILLEREQHWIDHYKSWDREFGYNFVVCVARNSGWHHTEEAKERIGQASAVRPRRKLSNAEREVIGERTRGKTYDELYGQERAKLIQSEQSLSYEEKFGHEKASRLKELKCGSLEQKYGEERATEIKAKMSQSRKGKCFLSAGGKQSLRNSKIKNNNPMYIDIPEEMKQRIVNQYGGVITKQFCEQFGLSRYKIKQVLLEAGCVRSSK